jgi:hypothetical protein
MQKCSYILEKFHFDYCKIISVKLQLMASKGINSTPAVFPSTVHDDITFSFNPMAVSDITWPCPARGRFYVLRIPNRSWLFCANSNNSPGQNQVDKRPDELYDFGVGPR